jgi:hypothetical protein
MMESARPSSAARAAPRRGARGPVRFDEEGAKSWARRALRGAPIGWPASAAEAGPVRAEHRVEGDGVRAEQRHHGEDGRRERDDHLVH